ncbi:MAG: GIY-YIG nuclease family protein [Pseudomonadota bacterium]
MVERQYYVYILANKGNSVLYTGVTNDLKRRVYEHRTKAAPGFTARYEINKLVYFEVLGAAGAAIQREKQIKGGSRADKEALVEGANPFWRYLYEEI